MVIYINKKGEGKYPEKEMAEETVQTNLNDEALEETKKKSAEIMKNLRRSSKSKNLKIFIFALIGAIVSVALSVCILGNFFNRFLGASGIIFFGICGVITALIVGFISNMIVYESTTPVYFQKKQVKIEGCLSTDYSKYMEKQHKLGVVLTVTGIIAVVGAAIAFKICDLTSLMTERVVTIAISTAISAPASVVILGFAMSTKHDESHEFFVCKNCDVIGAKYSVLSTSNHSSGTYTEKQFAGYKPSSENTLAYLKDDKGNEYRIYEKEHGHFVYNNVEFQWNSCDQLCRCHNCGHIQVKHSTWRRPV